MLSASASLDLALDLGVGKPTLISSPSTFPFGGDSPVNELVALNVALVWGL